MISSTRSASYSSLIATTAWCRARESSDRHAPSSPWYDRTNAEVWFRTVEAAEKAGFVNVEAKADEKSEEKAEEKADEKA